ncbi:MAG: hypothetical protein IT373_37620 [Polyangiaceae bacterium]|nr:hypothetical protein [Polyangiaceae bacterium]
MPAMTVPSRQTLDEVPARAFKFVMGYAESLAARVALAQKGFDAEEHAYAWSRLQQLGQMPNGQLELDKVVRDAVLEIDNWDNPNFEAIRMCLERGFGPQSAFLFENLQPAEGSQAVLGVETLLDRLDALESGVGRAETHEADLAALALLGKRGYTKAELTRLRGLVKATKATAVPTPLVSDEQRVQILLELYQWLSDWSAQARLAKLGRASLIRLGLAKRRERGETDVVTEPPVTPGAPGTPGPGTPA